MNSTPALLHVCSEEDIAQLCSGSVDKTLLAEFTCVQQQLQFQNEQRIKEAGARLPVPRQLFDAALDINPASNN